MSWSQIDGRLRTLIQRSMRGMDQHRENVILVGGLVKFFYDHHADFVPPSAPLRATVDLDVALTQQAIASGAQLHANLVNADLVPYLVLDTDGHPIEHRYQLREDGSSLPVPTCLEFVTSIPGRRSAARQGPRSAIGAAELRYVELLLNEPMRIEVPDLGSLNLPHPLAYAMQKTLIRDYRSEAAKRPADQADIVYACWGFQRQWSTWASALNRWTQTQPALRRQKREVLQTWTTLYGSAASSGSQEVASVFASLGQPVSAAMIARVMQDVHASIINA